MGKILIIKGKQVIMEIVSLESGEYAGCVYYDENKIKLSIINIFIMEKRIG